MQITSTMLRRIAAMPEQAMGPCLLLLAEQLEVDEAKRASAAQRQAEYASRKRLREPDVSVTSASHKNDASLTSDASRVDNLPSLSLPIERVREEDPPIVPPIPSEPPFFDAFWSAYPKRAGSRDRKAAVKAFRAACKRAAPAVIIEGALQYANYCRLSDKEGTELIRQARTWLNADGWTETYEIPRSNDGSIHTNWAKASAVLREQDRREGICREGSEDDLREISQSEGRTRIFG